jgi:hypothetical protein
MAIFRVNPTNINQFPTQPGNAYGNTETGIDGKSNARWKKVPVYQRNNLGEYVFIGYAPNVPYVSAELTVDKPIVYSSNDIITLTIEFSEEVTGFDINDLYYDSHYARPVDSTITELEKNKKFSIQVKPNLNKDFYHIELKIRENAAYKDKAISLESNTATVVVINKEFTCNISSNYYELKFRKNIRIDVKFNYEVTSFSINSLTISNKDKLIIDENSLVKLDKYSYSFSLIPIQSQNNFDIKIKLDKDLISSKIDFRLLNKESNEITITVNYEKPRIESIIPTPDPIDVSNPTFRIIFNDNIDELNVNEFSITNGTARLLTNVTPTGRISTDFNDDPIKSEYELEIVISTGMATGNLSIKLIDSAVKSLNTDLFNINDDLFLFPFDIPIPSVISVETSVDHMYQFPVGMEVNYRLQFNRDVTWVDTNISNSFNYINSTYVNDSLVGSNSNYNFNILINDNNKNLTTKVNKLLANKVKSTANINNLENNLEVIDFKTRQKSNNEINGSSLNYKSKVISYKNNSYLHLTTDISSNESKLFLTKYDKDNKKIYELNITYDSSYTISHPSICAIDITNDRGFILVYNKFSLNDQTNSIVIRRVTNNSTNNIETIIGSSNYSKPLSVAFDGVSKVMVAYSDSTSSGVYLALYELGLSNSLTSLFLKADWFNSTTYPISNIAVTTVYRNPVVIGISQNKFVLACNALDTVNSTTNTIYLWCGIHSKLSTTSNGSFNSNTAVKLTTVSNTNNYDNISLVKINETTVFLLFIKRTANQVDSLELNKLTINNTSSTLTTSSSNIVLINNILIESFSAARLTGDRCVVIYQNVTNGNLYRIVITSNSIVTLPVQITFNSDVDVKVISCTYPDVTGFRGGGHILAFQVYDTNTSRPVVEVLDNTKLLYLINMSSGLILYPGRSYILSSPNIISFNFDLIPNDIIHISKVNLPFVEYVGTSDLVENTVIQIPNSMVYVLNSNELQVYSDMNFMLIKDIHYTENTNNSIKLLYPLKTGDRLLFIKVPASNNYSLVNITNSNVIGIDSVVIVPFSYNKGQNNLQIYFGNGLQLSLNDHYTEEDDQHVKFKIAVPNGEKLLFTKVNRLAKTSVNIGQQVSVNNNVTFQFSSDINDTGIVNYNYLSKYGFGLEINDPTKLLYLISTNEGLILYPNYSYSSQTFNTIQLAFDLMTDDKLNISKVNLPFAEYVSNTDQLENFVLTLPNSMTYDTTKNELQVYSDMNFMLIKDIHYIEASSTSILVQYPLKSGDRLLFIKVPISNYSSNIINNAINVNDTYTVPFDYNKGQNNLQIYTDSGLQLSLNDHYTEEDNRNIKFKIIIPSGEKLIFTKVNRLSHTVINVSEQIPANSNIMF